MIRKIVFLMAVLMLFYFVQPAFARMGENGKEQMMATEMMEHGKDIREKSGMSGMGFLHQEDNAFGEYVTFSIDSSGNVINYGVSGITLFNISISGFNYGSTSSSGSVTKVSNNDGSTIIQLHDNPAAVINIPTNKNITITFTLADGVNATREDSLIRIESGQVVGYILGSGTIVSSVNGNKVKVDSSPDSAVIFRAAPVNMPMFDHRRFSQEMSRKGVGMEVFFGRNMTYSTINYSKGLQLRIQEMDKDRITLRINSTDPEAGRIIAINLDNSTFQFELRRLKVRYDNESIECLDDANEFFNITDRPSCWISAVQDRVRAQLMIHVPKYSEHTIEILSEPEATPTIAPGEKIITLDNNRQTITLQEVNEKFLLMLGENYDWNVTINDQSIVSKLEDRTGTQGLYAARKPGNTTLTAVGDPVCRKEHPPCMAPTIEFQIQLLVRGAPAASASGFEIFIAIAALLAVLARRLFD